MKKLIVTACALMAMSIPTWADEGIRVEINGKLLESDGSAFISSSRTMVPMRSIFEAFRFDVDWNHDEQSVIARRDEFTLNLAIDQPTANLNGKQVQMDSVPMLKDGRTYVPLRFVSESLGASVSYDSASRTVAIKTESLDQPVVFSDPLLRAEMKKKYGKETFTKADLFYTTSLSLKQYGIRSLAGIESFENLQNLDLSGNEISDISPVGKLERLQSLNLSDNNIMDIGPLRGLQQLKELDISKNRINSFVHLNYLKKLTSLKLLNNKSEEFSQIYYIADRLTTIDVNRSNIEMPKYDTAVARLTARFDTPITKNLTWVPASRIGGSRLLNEDMRTLLKQTPIVKQNQVSTFYESIQLLFANRLFNHQDVKVEISDAYDVSWTIYPGGADTLRINQGGQAGLASACNYLLADDYPERGYLLVLRSDNKPVVLNYFRSDKYITVKNDKDVDETVLDKTYYIVNYAAFSLGNGGFSNAAETGSLSDFNSSSGVYGNLLMTKELRYAVEDIALKDSGIEQIVQIPISDRKDLPIAVGLREGVHYLPSEYQANSQVLFSRSEGILYRQLDLARPYFSGYGDFDLLKH